MVNNVSKIIHELELFKRSNRTLNDYASVVNQVMLCGGDVSSLYGVVLDKDDCILENINDKEFIYKIKEIIGSDYYVYGY